MLGLNYLNKKSQVYVKQWLTFVCGSLLILFSSLSMAGGVRVIQNPDFHIKKDGNSVTIPTPSGATWYYWGDDTCTSRPSASECIAGWRTTDTGKYVEVAYASTYGNFGDQNNRIVAELNASSESRLYQPICLQSGETITMNYYFSPRNGFGNQQVAAGLWNINDVGPIGGAVSSQNSQIISTVGFTPQTAVFTAPADKFSSRLIK